MKKGFHSIVLTCILIGLGSCQTNSSSNEENVIADWVIINGKILTVDDNFSIVESMAIKDGLILSTGSKDEVLTHTNSQTKVTDLKGKTVIPGLIDNHIHYVRATKNWYRSVQWNSVMSRAQALAMVKERAKTLPKDEWVMVIGGFIFEQFQDNPALFTKEELDQVVLDRPLYIQLDYEQAFANSAALLAAGITKETVVAGHGEFAKNNLGELSGQMSGKAMDLMYQAFTEPTQEVWDQSLKQTVDSLLSKGLTCVYDVGGNLVTNNFYESVSRVFSKNELKMRVFYSLNKENSTAHSAETIKKELRSNRPDYTGLNFSQFGYGETVYEPMRSSPFVVSEDDQAHFKDIIVTAIENNWQIHEHTMREVKMKLMLDLLEPIAKTHPQLKNLRFTIAHTNGVSEESIQRAIDMNMVFAVHSVCRQMSNSDLSPPPASTIHKMGGVWGLGSDATIVASPNPFHTIGWVVSGRNNTGNVSFSETLSREDALRAHTATNAYILFKENDLGSLEPGKRADFVVLDRDYMTIPAEEIENLSSLMTVVNGQVVYEKL
ncbi:MAG: amidohydrolase [Imperialibacter sp.]|uniref:amidohydrolase n=1 Tax=Imperialibacter sp. TaxID=2038411 RepID=UPI0032EC5133